jgi:flavin reductase (DIM6/NTAB) family NADH-FMN oxidoreductase RutF
MTVTAFASLSARPPMVLVSLGSHTASARAIAATRSFGVGLLAADQTALARYGAAPGATKFLEAFTQARDGRSASPVVAGALAHLDSEVCEQIRIADHTVFFGRVRAVHTARAGAPLVYHRRAYRTFADAATGHRSAETTSTVA